jgi:hypothetical protein
VGAGLQRVVGGSLGATSHGGVTVRLSSADPARVRLATSATATAADFIDIPIANNNGSYSFYVHGIEGQTGTVAITATTPGFANGTANISVVPPYLDISGLNSTTTTLSVDDGFTVRIGIANAPGTFLTELQDIRTGGVPVLTTLTTSSPGVARLTPSTTNGTTATVIIPVGASSIGGVALDALTAGTTTVSVASTQAATTTTNGVQTVTVSAPTLTFSTSTVGAGLQRFANLSFGAPAPAGGMTVRLTSSQPAVLMLSPNASTLGTATLDVAVPAGSTNFSFYLHGVDSQVGTPTVSATAPGFADGTSAVPVVAPALDISGLGTAPLASAPDDPFVVRIGIPNTLNQFLNELQDRRAGAPPLTVTVTNSNGTAGQLVVGGGSSGQSVSTSIAAGQSNSPASGAGAVAFDPVTAGSTTVTATIPGFTTTTSNGIVNVTVTGTLIRAAALGTR